MRQEQSGGEASVNHQAGRDINVYGLSAADTVTIAREIARDIYTQNMVELTKTARETAEARANKLIEDLIQKLQASGIPLDGFRDPDVQYSLFVAQRDYARSGENYLRHLLTNLLASRCVQSIGDLERIVLTESIETARKLTRAQIAALTVNWLTTQCQSDSVEDLDTLALELNRDIKPFLDFLPRNETEYAHLQYTGCAQVSLGTIPLTDIITTKYAGLFQRGIPPNQIPDSIGTPPFGPPLFAPCVNNPKLVQIPAVSELTARKIAKEFIPEHEETYIRLLHGNKLADTEINDSIHERLGWWNGFHKYWSQGNISHLTLSSVGIAIAHNNWTSSVSNTSQLSTWISEAPRADA